MLALFSAISLIWTKDLYGILCYLSGDVARVNGQLAVSRAFGDKSVKAHLISEPDITPADIDENIDILILASDGIWKVIL